MMELLLKHIAIDVKLAKIKKLLALWLVHVPRYHLLSLLRNVNQNREILISALKNIVGLNIIILFTP